MPIRPPVAKLMWLCAEIAIIACDVAEVLGCALALKLLFGISLPWGIVITGLDTVIVLGLQGRGFRRLEAIVLGLILTIAICFTVELFMVGPDFGLILARAGAVRHRRNRYRRALSCHRHPGCHGDAA